jgi:hypothetical protein
MEYLVVITKNATRVDARNTLSTEQYTQYRLFVYHGSEVLSFVMLLLGNGGLLVPLGSYTYSCTNQRRRGLKIRSTRNKPVPVLLCPHVLTRSRIRAIALIGLNYGFHFANSGFITERHINLSAVFKILFFVSGSVLKQIIPQLTKL